MDIDRRTLIGAAAAMPFITSFSACAEETSVLANTAVRQAFLLSCTRSRKADTALAFAALRDTPAPPGQNSLWTGLWRMADKNSALTVREEHSS